MSALTQGTQLYGLIDGQVREIECITAFNPGANPADQIEDTCLSETNTRTYKKGLRTPGQASVSVDADPENDSHYLMWQLAEERSDERIQWAIGWSDGVNIAPTLELISSISAINVTNGGSGYTAAPSVTINGGGTGATAMAIVSGGEVTAVVITDPGSGYTGAATVAFSGGAGTGAAATVVKSLEAEMGLPTGRTWYTFQAYVSDFPFDFQANAKVTTAATMQRSGAGVWIRKAAP
ncbi:hypothetical protein D3C81_353650 [compost metagenome]